MIQSKCDHEWTYRNDYVPYGGGQIQPMYGCAKCNKLLPASEVFQIEALENQTKLARHELGFKKWLSILALIVSILALAVSIVAVIIAWQK